VNVTKTAATATHLDTGFTATVTGSVFGQPLYVDGWKTGTDAVFVATNENHVTALNATSGAQLWDVTLGAPVRQTSLPCGQPYTSYGVMETPVIDLHSRTLYVEAFETVGGAIGHYVHALSIDTGVEVAGWPVDIGTTVKGFTANTQNDRGGLTILNGTLYVPYAGLNGDCGTYHGWVVGISTSNPATVAAYSTGANRGGIWGAVSSDGTSLYAVTGNTDNTGKLFFASRQVLRSPERRPTTSPRRTGRRSTPTTAISAARRPCSSTCRVRRRRRWRCRRASGVSFTCSIGRASEESARATE
jgi:outer membrane protein assembly factor BamB